MSGMTVLIDTNIVLDIGIPNVQFETEAKDILKRCRDGRVAGFIANHTVPNVFYILRKLYSPQERKAMLFRLCKILKIAAVDHEAVIRTLTNPAIDDIEDSLQIECAKAVNADYIVTRDPDGFKASPIPAVKPADFLKIVDAASRETRP
jgi:predicted nucleic acid-binding protein